MHDTTGVITSRFSHHRRSPCECQYRLPERGCKLWRVQRGCKCGPQAAGVCMTGAHALHCGVGVMCIFAAAGFKGCMGWESVQAICRLWVLCLLIDTHSRAAHDPACNKQTMHGCHYCAVAARVRAYLCSGPRLHLLRKLNSRCLFDVSSAHMLLDAGGVHLITV